MLLPKFSHIHTGAIEKNLSEILRENTDKIQSLLKQNSQYTWDNLMQPLEDLDDKLHHFWSPINHMHSVVNTDELRKQYENCLPILSEYHTNIGHNHILFQALQSLASSDEVEKLTEAQIKIIANELRDFKLAGVDLPPEKKQQHSKIIQELTQLCNQFEQNIMDATNAWHYHVTDERDLQGIPDQAIAVAKMTAENKQKSGWLFSLESPSYIAVMMHADSQPFRKAMYHAFVTRASDHGPNAGQFDNSVIMQNILKYRLELAQLLGFNNFAQFSLATKMVKDSERVLDFLQDLVKESLPKAKEEFLKLQHYAKSLGAHELNAWDVAYYSEKLRQQRYDISDEMLRPYFPEPQVLKGLFTIVNKLFGINIKPVADADVWHKDVKCFAITDSKENVISYFYLDLYAREKKRGGAWMDDCQSRRRLKNGEIQLPIAFLTCNFNPPVNNDPALFSHNEVITLFHEFGHSLQHMLTKIDYAAVAGINGVPWDAVEIASQFLENWAWEKQGLNIIARHYKTGEHLPEDLIRKMVDAKNFQSAMSMVRQLEFALFDFRLHLEFDPAKHQQIQTLLDEVRSSVTVVPVHDFNRFQHSFAHIFAGGYAAGYYSYKWAEVMAADAFSLFQERGIFDNSTAEKFQQTFLESGGAKDPMELFINFRGREPKVDALLNQSGIRSSYE